MRVLELRRCPSRYPNECYYIGLRKLSSSSSVPTYWVDGSDSTYRLYKSGEPDDAEDRCFVVNCVNTEGMEDKDCGDNNRVICKMAKGKIILFYDLVLQSYVYHDRQLSQTRLHLDLRAVMFTEL